MAYNPNLQGKKILITQKTSLFWGSIFETLTPQKKKENLST